MKTIAVVAIVMVVTVATVFSIYDTNLSIQSKPDQVQVTNYSAAIDSLNPQINAIKNNISSLNTLKPQISSINSSINSLGTVKNDISDIKGKLSDLETKISQVQQATTTPPATAIAVLLDRSSYFQGDIIHITATGVTPLSAVQVQIIDNSGFVTMYRETSSDSSGKLVFDFPLSTSITSGNYQVKLVSGQQAGSQPIIIMSSSYVNGVTLSGISYQFTAQTDKGVYQIGDTIEVSGVSLPNSSILGVLTSPSGKTLSSQTTVQSDGTYSLFYASSQPFETGTWHITLQNQGLTRIVYLTVVDSSSSLSYPFTAQSFKEIYQPNDLIYVSGTAQPFSTVDSVLTSPSGSKYFATATTGSDGTYQVSYSTTPWYQTGNWFVTVTNQGQTREVSIFIETSTSSTSDSTNSFTAQTDKTIYQKGDQIQISGTAPAFSIISAVLMGPSGYTSSGTAMASFDGSYVMTYSTSPSFDTGNWHVTLQNLGLTKVVSIFLSP